MWKISFSLHNLFSWVFEDERNRAFFWFPSFFAHFYLSSHRAFLFLPILKYSALYQFIFKGFLSVSGYSIRSTTHFHFTQSIFFPYLDSFFRFYVALFHCFVFVFVLFCFCSIVLFFLLNLFLFYTFEEKTLLSRRKKWEFFQREWIQKAVICQRWKNEEERKWNGKLMEKENINTQNR